MDQPRRMAQFKVGVRLILRHETVVTSCWEQGAHDLAIDELGDAIGGIRSGADLRQLLGSCEAETDILFIRTLWR